MYQGGRICGSRAGSEPSKSASTTKIAHVAATFALIRPLSVDLGPNFQATGRSPATPRLLAAPKRASSRRVAPSGSKLRPLRAFSVHFGSRCSNDPPFGPAAAPRRRPDRPPEEAAQSLIPPNGSSTYAADGRIGSSTRQAPQVVDTAAVRRPKCWCFAPPSPPGTTLGEPYGQSNQTCKGLVGPSVDECTKASLSPSAEGATNALNTLTA